MAINIFGFELGKRKIPKSLPEIEGVESQVKSFIPPEVDDGASVVDFVGGYGFGVQLINYDVAYHNDGELVLRYRQMSEHAEVQTAIDDIVNQAVVLNEKSEPVSINLDKVQIGSTVKKKIKGEFDELLRLLQFNIRGSELFKKWYIDGRLYIQILMDEKKQRQGIAELRVIDPLKIKKIRNIEREVSGTGIKFIKRIQEYYLYTADDFVGNGKDTVNYRYSNEGIILPSDSVAYVSSGFIDPSTKKILGYLHKAIKPLNQLRMLEDSIVIYRISRAPERRIFYIDVGSLPKNKSEQYLREIMQRYRNKLVYDTATGELRDEKRHMSMLEDFWMPRREGGKGTEVQTLPGGQNLGELQDVEYFQKKLYTSLHVPASRFKEDTGFNMGRAAEISRDEVRFTKFVNRLQSRFSELFLQLLRIQLIAKNVLTEDEWKDYSYDISFDYATDEYFAELKENEMTLSRLQTLREAEPYLGRFISNNWAKKHILHMTDDEIDAMQAEIEKEQKEQPQGMEMGMPGMPGQPMLAPPPNIEGGEEVFADTGIDDLGALASEEEPQDSQLDIPEIEPMETEDETAGTTGATGDVSDDIRDMVDYYNEDEMIKASNMLYEHFSGKKQETANPPINEKTPNSYLSTMSREIFKGALERQSQKRD
jgi:hypothetical protein